MIFQCRNLKFGGGELAQLIKEGQVGRPRRDPKTGLLTNQHLASTNVTREKADVRSYRTEQSSEYHTELEKAAEARIISQRLDKLKVIIITL